MSGQPELENPAAKVDVELPIDCVPQLGIADAKPPRKAHERFGGKYPRRAGKTDDLLQYSS